MYSWSLLYAFIVPLFLLKSQRTSSERDENLMNYTHLKHDSSQKVHCEQRNKYPKKSKLLIPRFAPNIHHKHNNVNTNSF